jgi:hypothetical protein
MKWILRIAVALVILALAFPFVALTAMGRMNPTEGFCFEEIDPKDLARFADSRTKQELEQSYFNSPELAEPTMRIPFVHYLLGYDPDEEWLGWRWPVCERSRHAMHSSYYYDRMLKNLGEPNLRRGIRNGSVYRIVTQPSFSRVPIVFRLEVPSGGGVGTLTSAWLEEDGMKPDPMKTTPEGDWAWWNAALPRRSMKRTLTAHQTAALQALFADLPEYQMFNLDGVRIAIEAMHDGRREVRSTFLYPPPFKTGVLFGAVAKLSGIPNSVLEQGHVAFATSEWKP